MRKYHLYGLGAALVDTEIDVTDEELRQMGVDKGLMTLVDEQRQHELLEHLQGHMVHANHASGGSAANSVIAASYFGARTFYSCKVANDDHGSFYMRDLKAAGVDCDIHDDKDHGITGKCLVLITPDAERSMNTFLGISATLSEKELNVEALKNSEYLYMEGYLVTSDSARQAAIRAREIAEANGVKTSLSFSDPGIVQNFREGLGEMLGDGVDLLFCNEAEALSWARCDSLDKAVASLKEVAGSFAVTRGALGALVYDGRDLIEIAPYKVAPVDSNGAGDMFAGAFLYGLIDGRGHAEAGRLASLASATIVANYGPRLSPEKHEELLLDLGSGTRSAFAGQGE